MENTSPTTITVHVLRDLAGSPAIILSSRVLHTDRTETSETVRMMVREDHIHRTVLPTDSAGTITAATAMTATAATATVATAVTATAATEATETARGNSAGRTSRTVLHTDRAGATTQVQATVREGHIHRTVRTAATAGISQENRETGAASDSRTVLPTANLESATISISPRQTRKESI